MAACPRGERAGGPWNPFDEVPAMKSFLGVLVVIALGATVLALLTGVVSMMRGREFNEKYGNLLMRARVGSQAVTILLMLAYFFAD